jgi:DNA-binding transcriptional regulator YiaG/tetratricopeptide (TPR) repeat protein
MLMSQRDKRRFNHEMTLQRLCNDHATAVFGSLAMKIVDSWTGATADALRRAFRMTWEDFAGKLGVSVRTVGYWRTRPDMVPRPLGQRILDTAFDGAPDEVKARFAALVNQRSSSAIVTTDLRSIGDDVAALVEWVTATNTSDEAIENIERAVITAADRHTQAPARKVLADVLKLHDKIRELLRSGRQRIRQTRELLRLDGGVLAHASILLGDVGDDQAAENCGRAALLCLQEADASQMTAWYALAKTARWQGRYEVAADFAQQGFEDGSLNPMSVQLASYEANAAALLGDHTRARQALTRAESFATVLTSDGSGTSPWSFQAGRQAIFRLSVLLRTGDAAGALSTAAEANRQWAAGESRMPGTWAQIQAGAAVAHLLQDSLDGAVEQVAPVLALAPQFRIATVTGWLHDLDVQLAQPRFASSPKAVSLRQQIRDFSAGALPSLDQESE